MKEKTLTYLTLEIRAVFLCAKNSVKDFFSKPQIKISGTVRMFLVLFVLLIAFNIESYAQNCDIGELFCRGACRPIEQCIGLPPPPGLPIDSKLPFLLIAGLGLGIYYYRAKKIA